MRLVVVGASGNIGTALLRRLGEEPGALGPLEVVGVSRRPPRPAPPSPPRTRWVALDVAAPQAPARLRAVLAGADAVVHLAWGFQPSHDGAYMRRLDVGGSRAVVSAAVAERVPHLVYLSSIGAYSPARVGQGSDRNDDERPRVDESWPTDGVPTSRYSRHKAEVERMLDAHEATSREPAVARIRPGLVLQAAAASAVLRYSTPGWLPASVVRLLPVLPMDRALVVPMVHADDVAAALVAALERRATGAFNLAAEPPITRDDLGHALAARPVHVPASWLRAVLATTWWLRLQPVDAGWLDMAMTLPLLDTSRARDELGWRPQHDARSAVEEFVRAFASARSGPTPALRPRTLVSTLGDATRSGPVTERHLP